MRGQTLKRIFVSLFVMVLLLSMLPFQGTAEGEQTPINKENGRIIPAENADAQFISTEPNNGNSNLAKGEIIEERTENSKIFYNGNNTYTKNIYFEPIHLKQNGEYENISANLTPDKQDADFIETENTNLKSNFLSNIENGKYATFEYKNHLLEFSILEASGEGKNSIPVNDSEATYKIEDNQIFYKEIFPKIELRNFTFNQNAKEDIILNSYEGYHKFIFKIDTDLKAIKTNKGSISFVDDSKKEIFNIPEPYMTDSNYDEGSGEPQSSNKVTYELIKIDGGYKLIVDADSSWLKDPERKYPVFIDPSTSISITTDTWVSSRNPDTNYSSSSSKWDEALQKYVLQVGYYSSSTGTNYAYLKNPIANIRGINITAATFHAYVMKHNSTTANGLWLDRTDEPISVNSVTWNTKPNSTNLGNDVVSTGQWANFNVTSTVKGWANGTIENNGFKLHTNGNDSTYWKKIISSANEINKPYLSIDYTIPTPTSKAYSYGDGTGYVDLSWPAVPDATGYTVWVYNGKEYEAFDASNKTTWSTKGRKIWPIATGAYKLNHDGESGVEYSELPVDPSQVYKNSGGIYPNETHYWFRISAKYGTAESNMSEASTPSIPNLEKPQASTGNFYSYVINGKDGYADLNWEPVLNATGYKVWLFNGKFYESVDVGNVTSWSTKNQGIWPTSTEIQNANPEEPVFHIDANGKLDGKGTALPKEPNLLYQKMGTTYSNSKVIYFRLSAYNSDGETLYSDYYYGDTIPNEVKGNENYPQMEPPTLESFSNNDDSDTGYINISWKPVTNVINYQLVLFNGYDYSYWDVPANQTSWTTKGKGLFPRAGQIEAGNIDFLRDGSGTDLPVDPSPLYKKAFELNGGLDYSESVYYYIRVRAVYSDGVSPISYSAVEKIPKEQDGSLSSEDIAVLNELEKKVVIVDELLKESVGDDQASRDQFKTRANNIHEDVEIYLNSLNNDVFYESDIYKELIEKLGELDLKVESYSTTMSLRASASWRYGDVLYYGIGNKNAAGEKSLTGHTAVLSDTDYYVIEAARTANNGAKVFNWNRDKLWKGASGIKQYKVTTKLGTAASSTQRLNAVKYGKAQIGEPYATPAKTSIWSTHEWYCSKLTNAMWDSVGYNLQSARAYHISGVLVVAPVDITIDANVRLVKKWGSTLPGKL